MFRRKSTEKHGQSFCEYSLDTTELPSLSSANSTKKVLGRRWDKLPMFSVYDADSLISPKF
jgi:hypothetical protein